MVAMYDINKNEIKTKISNLWVLRIFHWHKHCNSEIMVFDNGGEARAEFEEQKEARNDCDKPSESTDWDISLTKGLSIGADLFTYENDNMHKKATAKKAEASSLWVIKVVHCYGDDGRFEVFDNASEARSRFKRIEAFLAPTRESNGYSFSLTQGLELWVDLNTKLRRNK